MLKFIAPLIIAASTAACAETADPLLLAYFIEANSPVYTELTPEKAGLPVLAATYLESPKIVVMDREELKALAKKEVYVEGLYRFVDNTIYISDTVDLESVYGASVVVHEMTHYTQIAMGLDKVSPCAGALERQAYEMQAEYLTQNGFDESSEEVDGLIFNSIFYSMCKPGHLIDRETNEIQ